MRRKVRRATVSLVGGLLLIVGVIAIPYPGPGWLIVFAALGILAREFPWAERVLQFGRGKYDDWNAWIKRQNRFVQSLTFIGTAAVVVLTLWLINAYGLIDDLLHLRLEWLHSPILTFYK